MRPQRVLILMSHTGGGHRASAEALRVAFREQYGAAYRVDIVDLWIEHTPWPINRLPRSYRFLADNPPLWKLLFEMGERPELITPLFDAVATLAKRDIRQVLSYYDPDVVVSVHPLLQEVPMRIMRAMGRRIPFVTVVTDLGTFHPTWFHRDARLCFVPTEAAAQQAQAAGLSADSVRQYGLPIHPIYAEPPRPRDQLRGELGMALNLPAVLLVGGGEGMGPVKGIAIQVAARLAADGPAGRPLGQLAIVCGRNRRLYQSLHERKWPVPTVISGFVENMYDWMAACDCIITKAGPGTIAEALARGLPILLSGYLLGQEEGNVAYVLEHGVGAYSDSPKRIAALVARWLGPESPTLEVLKDNARRLGAPGAAFRIVRDIVALLAEQSADAEVQAPGRSASSAAS